jgi:hypothetical protein
MKAKGMAVFIFMTIRKERNAHFMDTTAISGAAPEPARTQETLNWRAFSVGGHNRPNGSNDQQGWQKGQKYCNATTAGRRLR